MKVFTILLISLLAAKSALGNTPSDSVESISTTQYKKKLNYFVPVQYAGNIGFLSSGIGYASTNGNYQISLLYGYSPKSFTGVEAHIATAKNTFHLAKYFLTPKSMLIPYASAGISLELGGRSFFFLPENMPKGYYHFPKSIHLIPALGAKLYVQRKPAKLFQGIELFAEATTVDAYVWYKLISNDVKFSNITSLAVGVNFLHR